MINIENMQLFAKNLTKQYNGKTIVENVSLEIKKGEIVALLGVNGAGKTTTFYMMAGLEHPTSGNIFLNNDNITNIPIWSRSKLGIGYLPQEQSIFTGLTVEENILLPLELRHLSRQQQYNKVEELLLEFGMEEKRKTLGGSLSGGEKRKIEIARLLTIDPSFILIDEPFASVDPLSIEVLQKLIQKLKQKNIGILITDHNTNATLAIADKIYIISKGTIFASGNKKDIINNKKVQEIYLGKNFVLKT